MPPENATTKSPEKKAGLYKKFKVKPWLGLAWLANSKLYHIININHNDNIISFIYI